MCVAHHHVVDPLESRRDGMFRHTHTALSELEDVGKAAYGYTHTAPSGLKTVSLNVISVRSDKFRIRHFNIAETLMPFIFQDGIQIFIAPMTFAPDILKKMSFPAHSQPFEQGN